MPGFSKKHDLPVSSCRTARELKYQQITIIVNDLLQRLI